MRHHQLFAGIDKKLCSLLSLLFCFAVFNSLSAQKLVNVTGNTVTDGTITIEYSVGELAITTFASPGNLNYVTQGLLQPTPKYADPGCEIINDTINFFPNPTINVLSLVGRYDWITGYHIYAADGKLVRVAPFISNQINMYNLPGGVYFIRLFPGCNNKYRILKVIKQ